MFDQTCDNKTLSQTIRNYMTAFRKLTGLQRAQALCDAANLMRNPLACRNNRQIRACKHFLYYVTRRLAAYQHHEDDETGDIRPGRSWAA